MTHWISEPLDTGPGATPRKTPYAALFERLIRAYDVEADPLTAPLAHPILTLSGGAGQAPRVQLDPDWAAAEAAHQAAPAPVQLSHPVGLRAGSLPSDWTAGVVEADAPDLSPKTAGIDPKKVVIVAVIDDAINLAHDRFRATPAESRVDYAWVMDGTHQSPSAVPFGREWTGTQISQKLQAPGATARGILTELELQDHAQVQTAPLSRRITHGTHIADIACGYAPGTTTETGEPVVNRRIIAVQLPRSVILEASGTTLQNTLVAALEFVRDRAARIAKALDAGPIPLVVNFSFSAGAGPHNGQHVLEQAMAGLVASADEAVAPVHMVLPAGNRFELPSHAASAATDAAGGPLQSRHEWRVYGGDASPNFLEVWVPDTAKQLALTVTPPEGAPYHLALPGALTEGRVHLYGPTPQAPWAQITTDRMEAEIAQAGVFPDAAWNDAQPKRRILICVGPTLAPRAPQPPAPAGLWQIEVTAELAGPGKIEVWVQRDEQLFGYQRQGAAAHLVDPGWSRDRDRARRLEEFRTPSAPGSALARYGSLNALASHPALVVANARRAQVEERLGVAYPMSSYASAASDTMIAPGVAAIADRSRLALGIPGAGSASGSVVYLNGTSVAAPQVARAMADRLAVNRGATFPEFTGALPAGGDVVAAREGTTLVPPQEDVAAGLALSGLRRLRP